MLEDLGNMTAISIKNVSFSYSKGRKEALKKVNLEINEGEFIALLGANGSGKSTLAKALNGLLIPDSGSIEVFGKSTTDKANIFEIRKSVGVVFQNPDNQLIASIVEDDIAFGPENIGLSREEIGERIEFALNAVGMSEFRKSTPTRLSGGQKQRIAIAGVLAIGPKILVLDESTAMLDPKGRKEVMDVIKKLNKEEGITVIHITHYMDETIDADRIVVLSDGEVVMQGKPIEIFGKEKELKSYGLELPEASYIAKRLEEKGFIFEKQVLTKEDLTEGICKSL